MREHSRQYGRFQSARDFKVADTHVPSCPPLSPAFPVCGSRCLLLQAPIHTSAPHTTLVQAVFVGRALPAAPPPSCTLPPGTADIHAAASFRRQRPARPAATCLGRCAPRAWTIGGTHPGLVQPRA